jgi:alpha-galactosidase
MSIHANKNGWVLETKSTGYALGLNEAGFLVNRYWGARLPFVDDYPTPQDSNGWASFNGSAHLLAEEYPGYAGTKYNEPTLKVTFADQVRDVVLRYASADVDETTLTLHLVDAYYPFQVNLHYRVHEQSDLIERWVSVTNTGADAITLERIWSALWHMPYGEDYRLTHLSGRWYDEMHIRRDTLTPGVKVLDSRRITTSHHHNPWFAVDRGSANETQGEVWFGVLAWSGNWKLIAEVNEFMSTRIGLGINDFDFNWTLNGGETFTAPSSFGGYTRAGFGAASRVLHDFVRDEVLPHGKTVHKVLYNSWEATYFDFDVNSQIAIAEVAAQLGIELFVMDDGWFRGRVTDNAGLGDWQADPKRFPDGLNPLVERVNALGMDFGIWIEPEMVNPNSDLYRAHPDWVIHFPTRARTEGRNQLILNFGRTDVQDNIIEQIDTLLSDHNIAFIKWDMNRNVSEPGWPDLGDQQRKLWVRYVQGVYRVWGTLRERHPNVIWQSCSGGGGRADVGILKLADQIWVSDNTRSPARINIQEGFSYVYPANTMEAWVTDADAPFIPLKFKFHVSMCGSLGIGANLFHWSADQRAEAAKQIALYKEIRPIIQLGDQYRLRSAQAHAFSAVEYVSKDKSEAVLFAFRKQIDFPTALPAIYLQGLEPNALYRIESTGEDRPASPFAQIGTHVSFEGEVRSGAAWMNIGLRLELKDFESTVLRIKRV